ncbi:uncharacterized protein LOC142976528 [Anticarsia gemmatalis]|uniref:uncharacterized protein LOC142976528 n=1 Tax=Anticarsia gemmatalis TaxID=129554 RepID=UPI003F767C9A
MLQNMLITALTPLSNKTEINSWENQPFTTIWPEKPQQKVKDITRTIKKKPKRVRTAFSTEQIRTLERTYARYKYIDSNRRSELAKTLNIGDKCIKIWFQNRRMKEKKESSESGCDSSSECSNETPSVTASPPPQVNEHCKNEFTHTNYYQCNNSEYSYQLPSYYSHNGVPQNMYGTQAHGFYNDGTVYPTHYYPVDMNYTNVENNCYNHYGNEMNQYWASNHHSYYSQI